MFEPGLSGTCAVHAPLGPTGTAWPAIDQRRDPGAGAGGAGHVTVGVETVVPLAGEPITIDGRLEPVLGGQRQTR